VISPETGRVHKPARIQWLMFCEFIGMHLSEYR
jgi:hypothetical protein